MLIAPEPLGQPPGLGAGGGGVGAAGRITAVGTETAAVEPAALVAVTRTRRVFPWSTAFNV
jgi:hypothetical protein